jgi:2-polyprenyl-3-methyl-5-hydroxy-6-metoxy-1,4-benzoquinol methylase
MNFKKNIKKLMNQFNSKKIESISEDQYYEQLFVDNEKWNKANPNEEELLRWNIIKKYIKVINSTNNLKILDLGSGRGWLTNLLSEFGEVIGIEPVQNVVTHAKKLFPKIKFINGTSEDLLNEYGNQFDLIVSSEVIEHIPDTDKTKFVDDIFLLLKKNGHVIITTPRKDVQKLWYTYLEASQPIEDWILEEDLKTLFEKNGFQSMPNDRISVQPNKNAPFMDIYQVWLFNKHEKR